MAAGSEQFGHVWVAGAPAPEPADGRGRYRAAAGVRGRGADRQAADVAVVGRDGRVPARTADCRHFFTRVVLVEAVSSAISSAFSTRALEPHGAGVLVVDVDHLAQPGGGLLVAGLGGELDRAAELGGRGRGVARGLRGQAFLDRLGQLGLPGVVRDLRADPRGQRLVGGPQRLDQALRDHVVAEHQLHPGGELLLPDSLRGKADRHVVVAGLVTPRAGRVRAGQRR